ncbi:MAG: ABC transporter permease [Solirubrobacteraceae bacterium]
MSTTTIALPRLAAAPDPDHRPTLRRLVAVELRKTVDTRAGRWLLGAFALALALPATIGGVTTPNEVRDSAELMMFSLMTAGLLLPVLTILAVAGEWSQRTALATFTLVPDRDRVLAGKVGSMLVLAGATAVGAWLMAIVGTGLRDATGGAGAAIDDPAGDLGRALLYAGMIGGLGLAFGLLVRRPAPAIVLYFGIPTVLSLITELVSSLDGLGRWVDPNQSWGTLAEGTDLTGTAWARVAVTAVIWVAVPLIVGLWRVRRADID